jgi:hypothetical protein
MAVLRSLSLHLHRWTAQVAWLDQDNDEVPRYPEAILKLLLRHLHFWAMAKEGKQREWLRSVMEGCRLCHRPRLFRAARIIEADREVEF